MGSFWLTGGGFGLDSSWFAFFVILALLPVVYRATRELDFRYNAPVLEPAGIPVDLDAAARRQHEAAMGAAAPSEAPLVQIAPAQIATATVVTSETASSQFEPAVSSSPRENPAPPQPNSGNESLPG
jgi:hypothetical protein